MQFTMGRPSALGKFLFWPIINEIGVINPNPRDVPEADHSWHRIHGKFLCLMTILLRGMADTKYAPAPAEPPPSYETAARPKPPRAPALRAPLPLDLPVIKSLQDKRCILASASPQRRQLLAQVDSLYSIEEPKL